MITFSLQSGSNGNAIYVEADGVRLLFDAGISGRQAAARMARHGRDIRGIDALILSHWHRDHVRCAGVYHRLFHLPVYGTRATFEVAGAALGELGPVRYFVPGQTLSFGRVRVHTLPTPHDAEDSVAFVVEAEGKRLGVLTDLGHPFGALVRTLPELDAVYLESNYDPHLLEVGSYPPELKARIRGGHGHLSNQEAARLLASCRPGRLRWVALAHLSTENNCPELALETHRRLLGRTFPLTVASRYGVTELLVV
jgi:phosphoribosyl 1,2-cyclic phosphodiesterase